MPSRLLWVLLLALGAGLVALVLNHGGTFGPLEAEDFASALVQGCIALFLLGGLIAMFRGSFGQAVEAALFWIVIAFILAVGYSYRAELKTIADRVLGDVVPGRTVSRGNTVELSRARGGDFRVTATVNGENLSMILDTGASAVVLTHEAAKKAGLPIEVLTYTVAVETANGRTRAAPITLDRLAVGTIVERAVPALVAQPGQLRTNLLGMSFLNRLEGWEVRGDRLTMRAYP